MAMSRRWWLVLALLSAIEICVRGIDLILTKFWGGYIEFEVEFVITDAQTGMPVQDAKITLRSESILNGGRTAEEWTFITDGGGSASRSVQTMFSVTRSGLVFTDAYSAQPPSWHYRVE